MLGQQQLLESVEALQEGKKVTNKINMLIRNFEYIQFLSSAYNLTPSYIISPSVSINHILLKSQSAL